MKAKKFLKLINEAGVKSIKGKLSISDALGIGFNADDGQSYIVIHVTKEDLQKAMKGAITAEAIISIG